MVDYEVELGTVTEHRDASNRTPLAVDVEVHVQRATGDATVGDATTGTYDVSFEIADGTATLGDVTADRTFDDLALVAVRAAADELDASQDEYAVSDPVAAAVDREYTVFDQLP